MDAELRQKSATDEGAYDSNDEVRPGTPDYRGEARRSRGSFRRRCRLANMIVACARSRSQSSRPNQIAARLPL